MIGRLSGTLAEKNPPQILLDVHGIAYEVNVPMSTFYNLPAVGEPVTLFTHLVVREDAHLLFGFGSESERGAFRQLIKISGIGARTALSVLSGLSVAELAQAVASQEWGRLTRIPGIGKKTAERLLLELKDKLGADVTTGVGVHRPPPVSCHAKASAGQSKDRRFGPNQPWPAALSPMLRPCMPGPPEPACGSLRLKEIKVSPSPTASGMP